MRELIQKFRQIIEDTVSLEESELKTFLLKLRKAVIDYQNEYRSKGGQTTAKKYGKKHFSEAGKKGMAKRWKNKRTI